MPKKGTTRYTSNKQEKRIAKDLSGTQVVASGALWGAKGDVRTDTLLIECKTTAKGFYRLTRNTWDKITTEAVRDGIRIPVMCIDLFDGKYMMAVFQKGMFDPPELPPPSEVLTQSILVGPIPQLVQWVCPHRGLVENLVVVPWAVFLEIYQKGDIK